MGDIDDILLKQQEQEQEQKEQFRAGGNGQDEDKEEESETPTADEELKQYQGQGQEEEAKGQQQKQKQEQDADEDKRLAVIKLRKEDIDFMFEIITRDAQHDGLSIKQLFLGMMSTFTRLPIPHVTNSEDSGAGKSYLLNHVASFIPD
jgi:hypothetical protein